MTRLLVVVLLVSALLAGCAGPGEGDDEDPEFTEEPLNGTNESNGTATPDNDAGAEPVNPPADGNGTNATTAGQGEAGTTGTA